MEINKLKSIVEALIFAAEKPISASSLAGYFEDLNGFAIEEVVALLNDEYIQTGRAFQIVQVAGGYQINTRPEFAGWIKKMYAGKAPTKLTQASLEALAIIAFNQPISKTEVSAIRGVNSDGVIKNLLERRLIQISGRGEGVGRPLLYTTTPEFLQYFGINEIEDLPKPREIEELFGESKFADQIIEALDSDEPEGPASGGSEDGGGEVQDESGAV